MSDRGSQWNLAVHGPMVVLECGIESLEASIEALLGEFAVPECFAHILPALGNIQPYDPPQVLSRLSPTARHLTRTDDLMDVYEEGGRYWLVDERWGMAEIDLQQNTWQSWVLPQPTLDPLRVVELSVLWPMAQLLRPSGLHLLPAVSAVRDGFAMLLVCPFGVEPELSALINNGYRIIGQRWTAVREEDGRLALLHMPGRIERFTTPRLRYGAEEQQGWLDVTAERPGSRQHHAFCDAVLVAEPGRRAKAHLREPATAEAVDLLRREWPISELHLTPQATALPLALAELCRCYEVQLSRNTKDLLVLLNSVRYSDAGTTLHAAAA